MLRLSGSESKGQKTEDRGKFGWVAAAQKTKLESLTTISGAISEEGSKA